MSSSLRFASQEYRSYEMETQYTFRNKNGESLRKLPGSTQGQPFDIADCDNCTLEVLDNTDMVQIGTKMSSSAQSSSPVKTILAA